MTYANSPANATVNRRVDPTHKESKVVGGRANRTQRRVIEIACAKLGKKKGHFIVESAFERALPLLSDHELAAIKAEFSSTTGEAA